MRWLIATLLMFPVVASAQEGFQLSSGNISCDVDDNAIRCDHNSPNPPLPAGCDASFEPPRFCRRLFGFSHAANAGCSSAA